jgi:cytochrome c oxidase subunit 3
MSASLSLPANAGPDLGNAEAAASTGLWVFIGVVSSLFGLFFAAYVMRLSEAEGYPLALPWQFWLSTGLLVAGSLALQGAAARARAGGDARPLWRAGGFCALAFVLVQLWAWSALAAAQVLPQGNPAASFLYVLTGLHALHVLGGAGAWLLVARRPHLSAWRIRLCARYWHFLLALWLILYATLGLLTPDLVRAICGVPA